MKHGAFWTGQGGLDNIKPKRIEDKWESFSTNDIVRRLCGDAQVVEIGCGTGRLCTAFKLGFYFGYDLNPDAIKIAAAAYPDYFFSVLTEYDQIGKYPTVLLHSAALHIPDEELRQVFSCAEQRIVIGETMHGTVKNLPTPKPGLAFHYSRSVSEYCELLPKGWACSRVEHHKDSNSCKTFTYAVFKRMGK